VSISSIRSLLSNTSTRTYGWQSWCLISLLGCFSRLHIGLVYPNICRWWSVFSGNLIIWLYITQRGWSIVTSS
jgi:hypothetical protein